MIQSLLHANESNNGNMRIFCVGFLQVGRRLFKDHNKRWALHTVFIVNQFSFFDYYIKIGIKLNKWHLGKYVYLLPCWELEQKIDATTICLRNIKLQPKEDFLSLAPWLTVLSAPSGCREQNQKTAIFCHLLLFVFHSNEIV